MSKRPSNIESLLNMADEGANRSPCSRRKFYAIIEKNGCIISTGYNGSARGTKNCGLDIPCLKDLYKEPMNVSYEHCPATPLHAEMNAVINGGRLAVIDGTMILGCALGKSEMPCVQCRRVMINAGLRDCYWRENGKICYATINDFIDMENKWMNKELGISLVNK